MSFRARMFVAVVGLVLISTFIAYGIALWSSAVAQLGAESTAMAAAIGQLPEGVSTSRTVDGLVGATGAYAIRLVDVDFDTLALATGPRVTPPDTDPEVDNHLVASAMNTQRTTTQYVAGAVKSTVPVWNESKETVGALIVTWPGDRLWGAALWQARSEWPMALSLVIALVLLALAVLNVVTKPVARLGAAAEALDSYTFRPGSLNDLARTETEIGRIARLLQRMAKAEEGWRRSLEALRDSRDELEVRVQTRTMDLAEKSHQLEMANQHKSEFLANMSHELRTPLNAVIGFSEVLLEKEVGGLNNTQEEYLNDVLTSGTHLLALINDILDLAKVEAGKMELELSVFPLRGVLETGLSMVRERATSHGIQLHVDVDPQVDLIVADERKVKQIVFNLLSNAVKFTPDGGSITVQTHVHADIVEVSVTDTGIGIQPEDQPKVFEAFQQVGTSSRVKHEGTGLGLALVKHMVELHGGTVWVASQVGRGSTFTVTLPLRHAVPEQEQEPDGIEPLALSRASDGGELILIVEDDAKNMRLARDILQRRGYLVLEAESAEEGIEIARQHHPDLVLMDIQLPGMDGMAALQHLRADPSTANIRVVALTAFAMKADIERIVSAGFDGYMTKPIDVKTFAEEVREYCRDLVNVKP
jgi:signal transduction histidine kinase/ActR/RegA family two-component response regulator